MKREDIKKAAREYACDITNKSPLGSVHYGNFVKMIENAYMQGAEWRINSVWHNASEKPDTDKGDLLVIIQDAFGKDVYVRQNAYYVLRYGCKHWAYIEDLLPNMED